MLGSQAAGSIKAGHHKGLSMSWMLNSFGIMIPQVLAKKGNGSKYPSMTNGRAMTAALVQWKSFASQWRTGAIKPKAC
jgi:hypothetical protein